MSLDVARIIFQMKSEFSLLWTPREQDVLADALIIGDFSWFGLALRRTPTSTQALEGFPDLVRYTPCTKIPNDSWIPSRPASGFCPRPGILQGGVLRRW